ncbi:hypothetical protein AB0M28_06950 [Streptomyces sp. NPDC051940]|uniref:hypothetical protein n=1 Tax=Streptomyces sp. NPDC051940 TaxID=3155675 RepID=UPI003417583A
MITEAALLESRSLRSGLSHRTDVLDKVKALVLMPDGVHASTPQVADYYEVTEKAVNNLLGRHREELIACGLSVLQGADLQEFVSFNLKLTNTSYPQARRLALWPRRAILCAGMLLRDSAIAQRVRHYLLDAEESTRTEASANAWVPPQRPGGHTLEHILIPVMGQLGELNQRMAAQTELVCAMSVRLADVQTDIADVRTDMAELREDVTADVGGLRTEVSELRRDFVRLRRDVGAPRRRRGTQR